MKRLVAIHIRYLNMYLLLLAIVGIAKMNYLAKMKYITDQGTCFADHTLVQTATNIMLEIY